MLRPVVENAVHHRSGMHGISFYALWGSCTRRGTANGGHMLTRSDGICRGKDYTSFARNDIHAESARRGRRQECLLRVMGDRTIECGVISGFDGVWESNAGLHCARMMMVHREHDDQKRI